MGIHGFSFLFSLFSVCSERDSMGLRPNAFPPPSSEGVACKLHDIHLTGYNTKRISTTG